MSASRIIPPDERLEIIEFEVGNALILHIPLSDRIIQIGNKNDAVLKSVALESIIVALGLKHIRGWEKCREYLRQNHTYKIGIPYEGYYADILEETQNDVLFFTKSA